jgi:hypothetical protein
MGLEITPLMRTSIKSIIPLHRVRVLSPATSVYSLRRSLQKKKPIKTSNLALLPWPKGLKEKKKSDHEFISESMFRRSRGCRKKSHAHFVNSVFEKIFSIGTSYFLHHAAVILRFVKRPDQKRVSEGHKNIGDRTTTYLGSR